MRAHAANDVDIRRPVEDVFAYLANPENDLQWRPGVLELRRAEGEGVGARYVQRVKGPGGRPVNADIEIVEHVPQTRHAFVTVAGPVRPRGSYSFAANDGGTQVRFELEADLRGPKALMAPMVRKTMASEVAQLLRAKELLERTR